MPGRHNGFGSGRQVVAMLTALFLSACEHKTSLRSSDEMRTALADLASAQDIYYSANLTYSADQATVESLTLPRGVTLTIERADQHGWRASATHEYGIETCTQSGRNDGSATLAVVDAPTCKPVGLSAGQLDVRGRKASVATPVVADAQVPAEQEVPAPVTPDAPAGGAATEGISVLLPMASTQAEDFGYPTQTIDRLAVRQLLMARSYDGLDRILAAYADSVRRDYRLEYRLFDAYGAFHVAMPELEPFLSEWVRKRPKSAAALLARATFFSASGWNARGAKLASETTDQQFERMGNFFRRTVADLTTAHRLEPKSIVAYREMMAIATSRGDVVESRQLLDQALKIQPYSFVLRATHMEGLLPRWGGSYEAMAKFAQESAPYAAHNPRIKALKGFVDWDKGRNFEGRGQNGDAIEAYQRALQFGDLWDFREERGTYYSRIDQNEDALEDFNRALTQFPQNDDILGERAEVEYELGRLAFGEAKASYFAQAFRDILLATAIDPADASHQTDLAFYRENIPEYAPPPPQ